MSSQPQNLSFTDTKRNHQPRIVFRFVALAFMIYLGLYFVLRVTHLISCRGNVLHWLPEKRELDFEFYTHTSIQGFEILFWPLSRVEISIRLLVLWLIDFAEFIIPALCLGGGVAAMFLMLWHLPPRNSAEQPREGSKTL